MNPRTVAPTLNEALAQLAQHETRGFTFVKPDSTERFLSFAELVREAKARALGLQARGFKKGDKLALVLPEGDEFVLSFLGAVLAGVVPVPMYPQLTFKNLDTYHDTVAHIVRSSHARALVTSEATRPFLEAIAPKCSMDVGIVTAGEFAAAGHAQGAGAGDGRSLRLVFLAVYIRQHREAERRAGHASQSRMELRVVYGARTWQRLSARQGRQLVATVSRHGTYRICDGPAIYRYPSSVSANSELRAHAAAVARHDVAP
jgi:acyl-CoA synthetase (AMP-forming)/AMP-acid ligase II